MEVAHTPLLFLPLFWYHRPMKIKSRQDLVKQARTYIDVPFKHRGRSKRVGVDCAGLLVCSLRDLGYTAFDKRVYGREPAKDGLRQTVEANMGAPIDKHNLIPGDVVLCRFKGEPHHVGLLGDHPVAGLSLIHSYGDVGKVVEHVLDSKWRDLIVDAYRFDQDEGVE